MGKKKHDRIWLIGGTSESRELAIALAQAQISCLVSVTTEAARSLYPQNPLIEIWVGKLEFSEIEKFFHQQDICAILDASHPFAVEISQLAIAAAAEFQLPYLRYERENSDYESQNQPTGIVGPEIHSRSPLYLDSFETLVNGNYLSGHRVLLTIGYRHLSLFRPWQHKCTLFVRLLPSIPALQAAQEAGFSSDRILAIRPPLSLELERALWKHWQISAIVTKASGQAGGEGIKRQLAKELNVKLLMIQRPLIPYPQQTHDLAVSINFCHQAIN